MQTEFIPLSRACGLVGGQAELARLLGVSSPVVNQWVKGKRPIPLDRCVDIERMTSGRVTCEQLRPDKADAFLYLRTSEHIHAAGGRLNSPVAGEGAHG